MQIATLLALAAASMPEPKRQQGLNPITDPILPQPGPEPDPEGERIRQELRERRRQNFAKKVRP